MPVTLEICDVLQSSCHKDTFLENKLPNYCKDCKAVRKKKDKIA